MSNITYQRINNKYLDELLNLNSWSEPKKLKMTESQLAKMSPFSGSSILNAGQSRELVHLCKFSFNSKWRLVYKGSLHGFGASDFHANCDDIAKTLTIVKSTESCIFGGYTSVVWDGTSCYKNDPNAFIFSLVNKKNQPIRIQCSSTYSVFCFSTCGPTFGDGNDLYIANNPNTSMASHSKLSKAYKHPLYPYESSEAQSFLAGSLSFQVKEIEVYALI